MKLAILNNKATEQVALAKKAMDLSLQEENSDYILNNYLNKTRITENEN